MENGLCTRVVRREGMFRSSEKLWHIVVLLLILPLTSIVHSACPAGDLTGDCRVDAADIQALAQRWLAVGEDPADFDFSETVGLDDYAVLADNWMGSGIPLVINEVMASNSTTVHDAEGQYDDWIELHNAGDEPIDIAGMFLTDDVNEPTKWRLPLNEPAATTIPGQGYLIIWTDGDASDFELHANFRLDADGESIFLYAQDGLTVIDGFDFGRQFADMSYGRYPDGSHRLRHMVFPTPAGQNIGVYKGFLADVEFSVDSKIFSLPFSLTLMTEAADASIYYTIDGTNPINEARGIPSGILYTGPIAIYNTTDIRAAAYKWGYMPTSIGHRKYTFVGQDLCKITKD